jgi:hypothetical protein
MIPKTEKNQTYRSAYQWIASGNDITNMNVQNERKTFAQNVTQGANLKKKHVFIIVR